MLHLLKLEWKKIAPNRMFQVSAAMYFILLPLLYMAVRASMNDPSGNNEESAAMDMFMTAFKFPKIWDTMAYWGGWLSFFIITYLAVWMVTAEHNFRTSRQNLITGMERSQYLTGKFLLLLVMTIVAGCYVGVVGFVFGKMAGGFGDPFDVEIYAIFYFMLQSFFYTSFAFMLAVLFRKSGMAMMVFFAYILVMERIVYYLVFLQLFENTAVGNYLPASAAWFIVPFYMFKSNAMGMMENVGNGMIVFLKPHEATLAVIIYIAIFWAISFRSYIKRDL